jgi:hypothetical protein
MAVKLINSISVRHSERSISRVPERITSSVESPYTKYINPYKTNDDIERFSPVKVNNLPGFIERHNNIRIITDKNNLRNSAHLPTLPQDKYKESNYDIQEIMPGSVPLNQLIRKRNT